MVSKGIQNEADLSLSSLPLAVLLSSPPSPPARSHSSIPSEIVTSPLTPSTPAFLPSPPPSSSSTIDFTPSPLFPLPFLPKGIRPSQHTPIPKYQINQYIHSLPPTPQSLAVILSRLGLQTDEKTQDQLVKAITHPSFNYQVSQNSTKASVPDNALLSEVGRSILGFVLSEYYSKKYPNLPTKTLTLALTSLTNRNAMESIGREVGLVLRTGKKVDESFGKNRIGGGGGVGVRYGKWEGKREWEVTNQGRHVKMSADELRIKGRKGGAVYSQEAVSLQLGFPFFCWGWVGWLRERALISLLVRLLSFPFPSFRSRSPSRSPPSKPTPSFLLSELSLDSSTRRRYVLLSPPVPALPFLSSSLLSLVRMPNLFLPPSSSSFPGSLFSFACFVGPPRRRRFHQRTLPLPTSRSSRSPQV